MKRPFLIGIFLFFVGCTTSTRAAEVTCLDATLASYTAKVEAAGGLSIGSGAWIQLTVEEIRCAVHAAHAVKPGAPAPALAAEVKPIPTVNAPTPTPAIVPITPATTPPTGPAAPSSATK